MPKNNNNNLKTPSYPIDFDFVLGCGAYRTFLPMDGLDATGRTLLEGRSIHYRPDRTAYRICPFPGSRNKHKNAMNVSAFRYLVTHQEQVKHYLVALSNYLSYNLKKEQDDSNAPVSHLLQVAYAAYKAPLMWLISDWSGHPLKVPPHIAVAARLGHGLLELSLHFLGEQTNRTAAATPKALYDYAEEHGNLIGYREVCAGPPTTITKFLSYALPREEASDARFEDWKTEQQIELDNIFDFASICWNAQTIAMVFNYTRLTTLVSVVKELNFQKHFCVCFPNALEIFQLVSENQSISNSSMNPYVTGVFKTQKTESSAEAVCKLLKLVDNQLSLEPSKSSLNKQHWQAFSKSSKSAMETVSTNLDLLALFPKSNKQFDFDLMELFFGASPYS